MAVTIKVKGNAIDKIKDKLDKVTRDKATLIACHNLMYKMMDPYVPFDTGTLAQNVEITDEHIRYKQPYAHYMYGGIVYGPNIPIVQNGVVVGFYSQPGIKKIPTGEYINYDKAHHPLATSHWDEAMMRTEGYSFTNQILQILERNAKKL